MNIATILAIIGLTIGLIILITGVFISMLAKDDKLVSNGVSTLISGIVIALISSIILIVCIIVKVSKHKRSRGHGRGHGHVQNFSKQNRDLDRKLAAIRSDTYHNYY
jgi:ATP/ADP translocase